MNKKYFILLLSVISFSCTTAVFKPTAADLESVKTVYPDVTIDQLKKGIVLYSNKCGGCHQIFVPNKLSTKIWDVMLPKMKVSARLDEDEYDLIVKYIKSKSAKVN